MQFEVGNIYEGKITGVTSFGAFVELDRKTTGLVHISEVALTYVKDINEHVAVGQAVKVKLLCIDDKGKMSLSIKKALEVERKQRPVQKRDHSRPDDIGFGSNAPAPSSFDDMLSRFKQDSDEKMQSIKRNFESKRGSSYKRNNQDY
ncbi:MAG: S1 RNA-binding domain-containing protein [Eubacteriales bacterium]|nr:S1 RNA-binding domain-containing protein [Eubacteriales bacterium]